MVCSVAKVLSLVFRADSTQFAGPTQVLPFGPTAKEAQAALKSLKEYLAGRVPDKPAGKFGTAKSPAAFDVNREQGQAHIARETCFGCSRRQGWDDHALRVWPQIFGVSNWLVQQRWLLAVDLQCRRGNRGPGFDDLFQSALWFLRVASSWLIKCNYLLIQNLKWPTDTLALWQGFLLFLHLASSRAWCLMWPDMFHKISRKTTLAIGAAPGGQQCLRKISRFFRVLRGPWHTCKFGKIILEARQHLTRLLEEGNEDAMELLRLYLPLICREMGIDETADSAAVVLDVLKKKGGRVSSLL